MTITPEQLEKWGDGCPSAIHQHPYERKLRNVCRQAAQALREREAELTSNRETLRFWQRDHATRGAYNKIAKRHNEVIDLQVALRQREAVVAGLWEAANKTSGALARSLDTVGCYSNPDYQIMYALNKVLNSNQNGTALLAVAEAAALVDEDWHDPSSLPEKIVLLELRMKLATWREGRDA